MSITLATFLIAGSSPAIYMLMSKLKIHLSLGLGKESLHFGKPHSHDDSSDPPS